MRATSSIGFRLTVSFAVLFAIIIGLSLFGLMRVDEFNDESSAIRERWLKNTRYLGDLNNYTSDFRALEATFLVAPKNEDNRGLSREVQVLDEEISKAQRSYESVVHDGSETAIYEAFRATWLKYRNEADQVLATSARGQNTEAASMYFTLSQPSFSRASDLLEQLNDRNNLSAQVASERAAAAVRSAWNYLSAAVIFSVLAALVIMLYVTQSLVLPLKALSKTMYMLAQGEMGVDIGDTDAPNELGEMARAVEVFRNNAIELKLSQRGLASQASMLEEKLAYERRLNQQQRNFISMASHEFRTPMNVIDGHAQRLFNTREATSPDKIAERTQKIRAAIKRMNVLIDNILRSAKVFDGEPKLYLHHSEFDLREILHEVCKLHREISQNCFICENLGAEPAQMEGDRDLLFQVFNNIISNAVKYSPPGEQVSVNCSPGAEHILVSIEDNGVGIPQSDLAHIFERYYRGSNVTSIVGTGIGLFFVKLVVDLHAGTTKADSRGKSGAKFTVTLPYKQARQTS